MPAFMKAVTFSYDDGVTQDQRLIVHTYRENGSVLPPFEGEPEEVLFPALSGQALAQAMFEALDPDNRISLCLFCMDAQTGSVRSHIVNRYGKEAN